MIQPYTPDRGLAAKARRRLSRLFYRAPLRLELARPAVTFSFDDVPESAALSGARLLEEAGARGVFYVCAGLYGRGGPMGRFADEAQIAALARRGHQIGGHTYGHLDCHKASWSDLASDLDRNDAALRDVGTNAAHFAWPYGEVSLSGKRRLARRYASLRGVHKGLVRDGADRNQLPGVGLEGAGAEALGRAWIDRAVREKAWLILYTHDVREDPSPWGCTPGALAAVIGHAAKSGCDIRTLSQVLAS